MATTAGARKTISIYNYPDHLNPFREEDNHNKIRFWTINRKLTRSNSISFSGFKDIRNSWSLRSFMKKGKKEPPQEKDIKPRNTSVNGANGGIEYRRNFQNTSTNPARTTIGAAERADRYVYGGSMTPLPRSRFQERLRSSSNYEVNTPSGTPRMARSEISGSRTSVGSTNPFDEDEPIPPVRAPRRKKRTAPLPPRAAVTADISVKNETSVNEKQKPNADDDLDDINCNIELKIVEDEDLNKKIQEFTASESIKEESNKEPHTGTSVNSQALEKDADITQINKPKTQQNTEDTIRHADSNDDILNNTEFAKVNIVKYRRNSSINEDDIKLRRGNLEDFHALSNKRSKSLTNTSDDSYVHYDINLNDDKLYIDDNGNDGPQKVVCKVYENTSRKQSVGAISNTEKEFMEIDEATRNLEREISKLNTALADDVQFTVQKRASSDTKQLSDKNDISSPNPIPKPRRSHHGDISWSISNENGNIYT
ncbi:uncharacterized protein LOC131845891 [Achroia grisella]|uniref:uncharacterized protein LOC131845891 n=1 Tax=Achroia grisella TaxID=688607 RepID=UPI0027D1F90B|nr:uncharacterized protein LOC131845891 [Achroia grisella]